MAIRIKRVPVRVSSRVRVNGRTATVTTRSTVGGRTTVRTKNRKGLVWAVVASRRINFHGITRNTHFLSYIFKYLVLSLPSGLLFSNYGL